MSEHFAPPVIPYKVQQISTTYRSGKIYFMTTVSCLHFYSWDDPKAALDVLLMALLNNGRALQESYTGNKFNLVWYSLHKIVDFSFPVCMPIARVTASVATTTIWPSVMGHIDNNHMAICYGHISMAVRWPSLSTYKLGHGSLGDWADVFTWTKGIKYE